VGTPIYRTFAPDRPTLSQAITTIGLDIAKSGFYVHGIEVEGKVIGARPGQSRQEN